MATSQRPAAKRGPRRNEPHVLAGEAPGGVMQVVATQLLIIGTIAATYIGLWMVLDDSARLPGTKVKPAPQPALPIGVVHEVGPTEELQQVRATQGKLIGEYGINEGKGTYRMPIERAMELTAQRGWTVNAGAFGKQPTLPPHDGSPFLH